MLGISEEKRGKPALRISLFTFASRHVSMLCGTLCAECDVGAEDRKVASDNPIKGKRLLDFNRTVVALLDCLTGEDAHECFNG